MTNKPIISMEKVFKKYENNALALNDIKVENLSDYFRFIKKKCIFAFKFSRRNEN